jgi:hypothetical protein
LVFLAAPAPAQTGLEVHDVCGGTTFVFCSSVRFVQSVEGGAASLEIGNASGAEGKGYRGAVITEVRLEGVRERDDGFYSAGFESYGSLYPGPLHTDFLDGRVYAGEALAFWGFHDARVRPGFFSFHPAFYSTRGGDMPGVEDVPPWPLRGGIASSCGEDLLTGGHWLFVTPACGMGSGSLVRTALEPGYDGSVSPLVRYWLLDQGREWASWEGRTLGPYDLSDARLVVVAQDIRDPTRVSVCRVGPTGCIVTAEPPAALLLLAGLLLMVVLGPERTTWRWWRP